MKNVLEGALIFFALLAGIMAWAFLLALPIDERPMRECPSINCLD